VSEEELKRRLAEALAHERAQQAHSRRIERLASLGTMAAGLAHEIRNPLNSASLQLTVVQRRLERDPPDAAGAAQAAALVAGELARLSQLTKEFLDFARPQPLLLERADLALVAQALASALEPDARAAGVTLEVIDGERVEAMVDRDKIGQAIHNLVRNAIEATGRGGRVQLHACRAAEHARLEVLDDGPGLPFADAPIFEPFFTTKGNGTGLGLSVVDRIVSDHGGKVEVDRRDGRTIFAVLLPGA